MTENSHRIEVLKDLLHQLHNGVNPENIQETFNNTFQGVSAIEISLMEHQLMSDDNDITFEDIMRLCNVHANLFKDSINQIVLEDAEHPGHPAKVLKLENQALQATIIRIHRILDNLKAVPAEEMDPNLLRGLNRQYDLMGQFKRIYNRKEQVMFPLMEKYGHDAPPKVMWGVDDQIRDLFDQAYQAMEDLPVRSISEVDDSFKAFEKEFKAMIFKEEQILLQILLEVFTQNDWLQVAEESELFGYAIIRPESKWEPTPEPGHQPDSKPFIPSSNEQEITFPQGTLKLSFEPTSSLDLSNNHTQIPFTHGSLSVEETNLIFDHLPFEISFIDKNEFFKFYNAVSDEKNRISARTDSQIGRTLEQCHPPKLYLAAHKMFNDLRDGVKDKDVIAYPKDDKYIHRTFQAIRGNHGEFLGVISIVQDIQPYLDLANENSHKEEGPSV